MSRRDSQALALDPSFPRKEWAGWYTGLQFRIRKIGPRGGYLMQRWARPERCWVDVGSYWTRDECRAAAGRIERGEAG